MITRLRELLGRTEQDDDRQLACAPPCAATSGSSPAAAGRLPLLSQLLGVRRRGARAPRRVARRLAGRAARVPLRPLASGRLRPGAVSDDGYPAPHPAVHLRLLAAHAVGGLGEGASAEAAATAPARRRSRAFPRRRARAPSRAGRAGQAAGQRGPGAARRRRQGRDRARYDRPDRRRDRHARRHAEARRAAQAQGFEPTRRKNCVLLGPEHQLRGAKRPHRRGRAESPARSGRASRERVRARAGHGHGGGAAERRGPRRHRGARRSTPSSATAT